MLLRIACLRSDLNGLESFELPGNAVLDKEVEMGRGRRAVHGDVELSAALHLIQTAATVQQLRPGRAMLLPALTGVTMATTARILGVNRDRVFALRRDFRNAGNGSSVGGRERRGGRRHAILSLEDEKLFIQRWQQDHREASLRSQLCTLLWRRKSVDLSRDRPFLGWSSDTTGATSVAACGTSRP